MDLNEEFASLTSNDEARYFVHFTNAYGDDILEDGLVVGSKKWNRSFLELEPAEKENITGFIEDELNADPKRRNYGTMMIAAVYKNEMDCFIKEREDGSSFNWEGTGTPDYIVDSGFFVGYIDTNTLKLTLNENRIVDDNHYGY